MDILNPPEKSKTVDIIHDKGTLDVFLMMKDDTKRAALEGYRDFVWRLLSPGGLLVVTSCNTTPDELTQIVTAGKQNDEERLLVSDALAHPAFQYGGFVGSSLASVAFVRHKGGVKADKEEDW
eukprot:Polyplicarium_translucidae@DN4092_c0_g1_i1.p3